jgi:hypothetical protein
MLTQEKIIEALAETGQRLDWKYEVEIILGGAAACVLTGMLPDSLTTVDCDVLEFKPMQVRDAVIRAAEETAAALNLPRSWLNDGLRSLEDEQDILPVCWQQRVRLVGVYGKLCVRSLGRLDIVAIKVYAGREKDWRHLDAMGIRPEEIAFVREYLESLRASYRHAPNPAKIAKALAALDTFVREANDG